VDIPPITGDPRFFRRTGPHSLAAVADAAGGTAPPRRLMLTGVAPLQTAGPDEVSFLDNRKYAAALDATRAGAVIVHTDLAPRVPEGAVAISTEQPYVAWARVAALFHPEPPTVPGIHPTALVGADARIEPTAEVGPYAVIGDKVDIASGCRIGPHAVIGAGVVLGRDCRVGAHASISHALIGNRVYIYTGVRIGQDGFGFAVADTGFLTVPQLGRVIIGDDVEIGANTTIDRGSMHDTVIGAGSRLDNLVMIGHNVTLGRGCVIVSQVGISGSTTVGDFVQIGGQAGLAGHLKIGSRARIGGQAGVMNDIQAGADVIGSPAQPVREFFRHVALLRKLARGRSADDAASRETKAS
jgi:UDP-3-O-[3-hydroxymyristoyl] glucosamine N-acyltransferase